MIEMIQNTGYSAPSVNKYILGNKNITVPWTIGIPGASSTFGDTLVWFCLLHSD